MTPVGSTAAGFISVRPANATGLPSTSNVNFTTGAINPNGVLVELPVGGVDDGKIEITFDALGVAGPTSDVLVDVVGYTTDAKLKSLEARIAALEAARPTTPTAEKPLESVTAADEVVVSVTMTAPVAGRVTVFSTSALGDTVAGDETAVHDHDRDSTRNRVPAALGVGRPKQRPARSTLWRAHLRYRGWSNSGVQPRMRPCRRWGNEHGIHDHVSDLHPGRAVISR